MLNHSFKFLLLLLCCAITFGVNAQREVAIISANSGLSFDVDHASQDDGAAIRQQDNLKNDNQLWWIIEVSEGAYRFQARHSEKYLTASNNGAIRLTQQTYTPGSGQEFGVVELGNGECYLRHLGTGRFVGVADGSKDPGARIVLGDEDMNSAQKFRLETTYYHVNPGRPTAPVTYSFSVKNTSMWDVSFRVAFGSKWSDWKYAKVSVNPKKVSVSSEIPIENYEIMWKDLTVWKGFSGGTPIIPDKGSMSLSVSGNTLTGIKLN